MNVATGWRKYLPTRWEVFELSIRLALVPLIVMPRAVSLGACRLGAAVLLRRGSKYRVEVSSRAPRPLVQLSGLSRAAFAIESEALSRYEMVLTLRAIIFPFWKPRPPRLLGLEHVQQATAAGNGVILWGHPCVASNVAAKQALFIAGFPEVHLSRNTHGFSDSPFGQRFVNPVMLRAETPFLAERVVMNGEQTVGPLRQLRRALKSNRVVSITVTESATSLGEFDFLDGRIVLPDGPVELAMASGAVLVPVFTSGAPGPVEVEIGAPLPLDRPRAEAVREAQRANLAWLEERVRKHPMDWNGWRQPIYIPANPESRR